MRPQPIIWFERVVLVAFGLGIINLYFGWDAASGPYMGQIIYFGSYALLLWLIGRKGSAIARGIFGVLVVIIGFLYLATLPAVYDMSADTVLGIAQCLLTLASLGLIFRQDTEPWFRGERPVDPEIFR